MRWPSQQVEIRSRPGSFDCFIVGCSDPAGVGGSPPKGAMRPSRERLSFGRSDRAPAPGASTARGRSARNRRLGGRTDRPPVGVSGGKRISLARASAGVNAGVSECVFRQGASLLRCKGGHPGLAKRGSTLPLYSHPSFARNRVVLLSVTG